jgi:hypothetical protein
MRKMILLFALALAMVHVVRAQTCSAPQLITGTGTLSGNTCGLNSQFTDVCAQSIVLNGAGLDVWQVNIVAGSQITFSTTGSGFTAFQALVSGSCSANGACVFADTAPNINATVTSTAPFGTPTGTYYLFIGDTNDIAAPGCGPYTLNVSGIFPPTIAQPLSAHVSGQNVTLSFGASNANSCTGSSTPVLAGWNNATLCNSTSACSSVSLPFSGVAPGNYSFTAMCSNSDGSVNTSTNATVSVSAPTFAQALNAIVTQQSVALSFGATGATSCTASSVPSVAGWSGAICSSVSACANVMTTLTNVPPGSYTFNADCSNAGGSANSSTNATVAAATVTTDLGIDASASATTLAPGQDFSMHFVASNLGAQSASGVQVALTTPPAIAITSSTCAIGTGSGASLWNVGTLAAGASTSCDVQATANTSANSIAETLLISFAGADSNHGNDMTTIPFTIAAATADVSVTLSASDPFQTGAAGSITLTVANAASASSSATGIVVHEYTSGTLFTAAASTCNVPADAFTWSIGSLAAGQSMSCTITGTVVATSSVNVTATVKPQSTDPNQANNTATRTLAVLARAVQESHTVSGAPTTGNSTHVALSGDSTQFAAVFESQDQNLISGNTNAGGQDVYRVTRGAAPVLENIDASGRQLPGTASLPAISDDAAIVAFTYSPVTAASAKAAIISNIFAGAAGAPKHQVDVGMGGAPPNGTASGAPSVSVAGSVAKLVFCSKASNLIIGDGNNANDIFLVDPANPAQPPQLLSIDATGKQLPGDSCEPKISADGNHVVFTTVAPSLYTSSARQVVSKDLVSGALDLISVSTRGAGIGADGDSSEPTLSADGSTVAFTSAASDLDALGKPVGGNEAFVSVHVAGGPVLKRLRSGDGTVPNGASQHPQISHDGGVVVMQTLASNFFGIGKALTTNACGAVAITTNFFNPSILGAALCNGNTQNQNPAISGDGGATGFDSNAPQPGTSSSNSNTYSQASGSSAGVPNLGSDFSGQWYDAQQSGQGLVIDVLAPQADASRLMDVIWFVFDNGQPTWLLGSAVPHAGTGADAGKVVVQMDQVGIYHGVSFPLGEDTAQGTLWGSIRLTFSDANTAQMSWTSTYAGFNSGTMALTRFLSVGLPAADHAGTQVKSCFSGNWKEPTKSGHGFEFEVIPTATQTVLSVDWFTYTPQGAPLWLQGAGSVTGNSAQMTLQLIDGSGAQFPPRFDPNAIVQHPWGQLTVSFSDATHAHAVWSPTFSGYSAGAADLVPTFGQLDRRGCQ